ncbi:MAG: hypothetical protein IPP38_10690 [Bacteroidetes bacterium]|nr:hypothetical protein [Bacteroidota bacterium]
MKMQLRYGMSVKPTLDGGYVIAGSGTVGTDIVLIKTDSQGFQNGANLR